MNNETEKSKSDGILKSRRCHVCNGVIDLYAPPKQIYCGEQCIKIAKLVSQQVIRQREALEKKGTKVKVEKMDEIKTCRTCDTEVPSNRFYCGECATIRKTESKRAYDEKRKRGTGQAKRGPEKKKKAIDPKWLVRGPISSYY